MSTQIQSLITGDTYPAVVAVPATGEVITESSLIDLGVALGDRIEFVRQLTPDAVDDPERHLLMREDFVGALDNSSGGTLTADLLWRRSSTAAPAVNGVAGTAKNPGQLQITMAGGTDQDYKFQPHTASGDFTSFEAFQTLTVAMKIDDDAGNSLSWCLFGLADDNANIVLTNTMRVGYFKTASDTQWILVVYRAGVPTESFTLLGALTEDEWAVFRLVRVAGDDIEVYLNGTLVYTIDAADWPVGACTIGGHVGSVADAAFVASFDFIYYRAVCGDRSGA